MDNQEKILIIDDDSLVCNSIANVASSLGYRASTTLSLREGLDALDADRYDIVFLDIHMPDGNGIDALPLFIQNTARPEVIIITGYSDPELVEAALSRGAWDYIEKPFSKNDLAQLLKDAVLYREAGKVPAAPIDFEKEGIYGKSPGMKECLSLLGKAARSDANVLLCGETGTGKELFARAIHNYSTRAGNDFIVIDCAAIPPTLVESILFGHEKGAYTGADRAHAGLVSQANNGTLFLDEVSELPLATQKIFLRILQEGRFRPVGKSSEVESDFRIISATNRDLDRMVEENSFRKDLLFRLKSVTITIPPLRDRTEDIIELANVFMQRLSERSGMKTKQMSTAFCDVIMQYPWPGNVRELIHAIDGALAVAHEASVLVPRHLPRHIHVQGKQQSKACQRGSGRKTEDKLSGDNPPNFKQVREHALAEIEKEYLSKLMSLPHASIETACKISGLSRSRLYALLKKHGIS
ncbi:MAG TPA: sigma-54 dependent transcriptional regulator [Deltaproteobacteria bacterium]|nr:sigma-54 dependent transcriptional regulator [Deltaproteobacteria bacterium]HPR52258.1 sigma-54 dependent transcriptional regulator [Deltaproteobacteria bacterium]